MVPLGVLGGKAGVASGFCYLYFATLNYFRSQFLGMVFGFINVVGRSSTVLAPIMAE